MWATVLVVYFIKFLYTVGMEGNFFFWQVTTSEAVVFVCERNAYPVCLQGVSYVLMTTSQL